MAFSNESIPGSAALVTLEARRASYRETGDYPFLIGDADELERVREAAEVNEEQGFDETVARALNVDLGEWIAERRAEVLVHGFSVEETLGTWPEEAPEDGGLSLHRKHTGETLSEVFLGSARIEEPWHLPAALGYGGWNECPFPEVHCAFHRRWQLDFGAEIVGMSGDVIECIVQKPPLDRAAAIDLAWQQYWYCADIVDQGCESICGLAATLLSSRHWYFWWD